MFKEYRKPASVREAMDLKKNSGFIFLAGGTEINRLNSTVMNNYSDVDNEGIIGVIDLEGLDLISIGKKEKSLSIGSLVTLQELSDSAEIPRPLKQAAEFCAARPIRNAATIGGNIVANLKTSYLMPCLTALQAMVVLAGGREVPVELYNDETPGELILEVLIPDIHRMCAVRRATTTAHGPSIISVAVGMIGVRKKPVVAICGLDNKVIRLESIEAKLKNNTLGGPHEIEKAVKEAVNPASDILGSSDYKKHIAGVLMAEAVAACLGEGK